MSAPSEPPTVVVSPHLDDAVLSAWSVLSGPAEVRVVNLCTALPSPGPVPWWDRMVGAEDSLALMQRRIAEDAEALALAGRVPRNLDFLDRHYRAGQPLDTSALTAALEPELAGADAVYAPAGLGLHSDHVAAREAVLALAPRVFLYADLPYATRFGWPHWVTGAEPRSDLRPEALWEEHLAGVPCGAARVAELSSEEAAGKLRAMETYRTQFAALNAGPLNQLRHPQLLPYEVFWELR